MGGQHLRGVSIHERPPVPTGGQLSMFSWLEGLQLPGLALLPQGCALEPWRLSKGTAFASCISPPGAGSTS